MSPQSAAMQRFAGPDRENPWHTGFRYSPAQEAQLRAAAGERLHSLRPGQELPAGLRAPLQIQGAESIVALPRHQPDDAEAPAVVHLLNTEYDVESDSFRPQRDFTLRLSHSLYRRDFRSARMHAPGRPAQSLRCIREAEATSLRIPRLEMWALLELE